MSKKITKKYILSKAHINAIDCSKKMILFNNPGVALGLTENEWIQFENQWSNEKTDYIIIWTKNESE